MNDSNPPKRRWYQFSLRTLIVLLVVGCLVLGLWLLFGGLPSFLRNTTSVYLKPDTASGVEVGTRVKWGGLDVGYVHDVKLTIDVDVIIELRIFDDIPLRKSDVCVIHRLHRYDTASLHIERRSGGPDADSGLLGDPPVMRCVIANGAWPKLPGLFEQNEN